MLERVKEIIEAQLNLEDAKITAETRFKEDLNVTTGTLTVNMNSLEKKQYIQRNRSEEDKRVVLVSLTEKGRKAFYHHRDYHWNMIRAINRGMDNEEREILMRCLEKLNRFLEEGKM